MQSKNSVLYTYHNGWNHTFKRETQCNTSVNTTLVSTLECDCSVSGVLNPKGEH